MEMTLGSPGIDWGNVADWLSILVNVFVGFSVFWLGHRTYQLTQQATDREDKAQREHDQQQAREGHLLLALFKPEVGLFRLRLEQASSYVAPGEATEMFTDTVNQEFINLLIGLELRSLWNKQARLHILPDHQAVLFVRLIASIHPLRKLMENAVASEGETRKQIAVLLRDAIQNLIKQSFRAEQMCDEALTFFKG